MNKIDYTKFIDLLEKEYKGALILEYDIENATKMTTKDIAESIKDDNLLKYILVGIITLGKVGTDTEYEKLIAFFKRDSFISNTSVDYDFIDYITNRYTSHLDRVLDIKVTLSNDPILTDIIDLSKLPLNDDTMVESLSYQLTHPDTNTVSSVSITAITID